MPGTRDPKRSWLRLADLEEAQEVASLIRIIVGMDNMIDITGIDCAQASA